MLTGVENEQHFSGNHRGKLTEDKEKGQGSETLTSPMFLSATTAASTTKRPYTTVAVFRCVVALPLSVMPWVAGDVTFRHLLSAAAGCPVPAASSRAL